MGEHQAMTYSDRVAVLTFRKLFGLCLLSTIFTFPIFAQAATEAASAASVSSVVAASPKPMIVPKTLPSDGPSESRHLPTAPITSSPEINRHDLETKAGKDAGKLLIRSTPGEARVWIDGKSMGTTPVLLIVAPGKYGIELRGQRAETARAEVALLPKETREVNIKLELRYPTRVSLH